MRIILSCLLLLGLAVSDCEANSGAEKEKTAALSDKTNAAALREDNLQALQAKYRDPHQFEEFVARFKKAVAAHDVNALAAMNGAEFRLQPKAGAVRGRRF